MSTTFTSLQAASDTIAELEQKCQLWEYRIPRIPCNDIWASAHAIERFRQRIKMMATTDISEKLRGCVRRNQPPYVGKYRFVDDGMILVCDFDGNKCVVVTVMRADQAGRHQ